LNLAKAGEVKGVEWSVHHGPFRDYGERVTARADGIDAVLIIGVYHGSAAIGDEFDGRHPSSDARRRKGGAGGTVMTRVYVCVCACV
jgi:hypothetical protein